MTAVRFGQDQTYPGFIKKCKQSMPTINRSLTRKTQFFIKFPINKNKRQAAFFLALLEVCFGTVEASQADTRALVKRQFFYLPNNNQSTPSSARL